MAKKVPAPNPNGAPRRDAVRRPPKNSDPRAVTKPQPQPQPKVQPKPQPQPAAQPPTKSQTQTKPQTQTKVGSNAGATPKAKTAPQPQAAPKPAQTPEPTWRPDGIRTPKPTAPLDRATEAPPEIPNWERTLAATPPPEAPLDDAQWEHTDETAVADLPEHAAPLSRRRRLRQSRAFVITAVIFCVLVAFVAGAAIVSSFHNPPAGTARPQTPSTSKVSPPAVSSPEIPRLLTATEAAETATVTARSALADLSGFPTPANVAPIINPYVSSLQSYQTTLDGAVVPPIARTAATGARSLMKQDMPFLSTINGLPSLNLGTYLAEFSKRSSDLQLAFGEVEAQLRASTR
jgi:hypothetical protein